MGRDYVLQELNKLLKSGVLSEDCYKAVSQAFDDVLIVDRIHSEDFRIDNPYDIYNNNQRYHGFVKGIEAVVDYVRGQK